MSGFWERIANLLGWTPRKARQFEMQDELVDFVRQMAADEQRPVEEITADLLTRGLTQLGQDQRLVRRWESLSMREQQATALTCLGCTNRQIAARLGIARETAKTYVLNAQRKFDVHSKAELRQALVGWDFRAYEEKP